MHKYIILFFSVLLFLTACDSDTAPEGVIPKQQMISLLTDIHLTDGTLYSLPQEKDSLYKYGYAKYQVVFKKYHTNDKTFRKSFEYYTTQPEVIEDMYNQIYATIQAKTDSINKVQTKKTKNALPKK